MSKAKSDDEQASGGSGIEIPGLIPIAQGFPAEAPASGVTPIKVGELALDGAPAEVSMGPLRLFRDKVYTSRTLIMPDGRTLPVSKGQVAAFGDDQFEFLSAHPDLELVTE